MKSGDGKSYSGKLAQIFAKSVLAGGAGGGLMAGTLAAFGHGAKSVLGMSICFGIVVAAGYLMTKAGFVPNDKSGCCDRHGPKGPR